MAEDSVAKESMSNLSTSCSGATFFLSEKVLLPLWLADTQMTHLETHLTELAFSSSLSNVDSFVVRQTISGLDTADSLWIARTCSSTAFFGWIFGHHSKSSCRDFWLHFPLQTPYSVHKLLNSSLHPHYSCTGIQTWIIFLDRSLLDCFLLSDEGLFLVEGKLRLTLGLSRLAFPSPIVAVSRGSIICKIRL